MKTEIIEGSRTLVDALADIIYCTSIMNKSEEKEVMIKKKKIVKEEFRIVISGNENC